MRLPGGFDPLLGLMLVGVVINALAPAFSGQRNLRQALN